MAPGSEEQSRLYSRSSPSREVREAVSDAFYAAAREEEACEARLRERIATATSPPVISKRRSRPSSPTRLGPN